MGFLEVSRRHRLEFLQMSIGKVVMPYYPSDRLGHAFNRFRELDRMKLISWR